MKPCPVDFVLSYKETSKAMSTTVTEKFFFVFVSNYLNHHQIPFCNAMYELCGGSFVFVQTEPMEEERLRMGWSGDIRQPYLKLYYEEAEECKRLILQAQIVMFGGCDEEAYIESRMKARLPVIRYSERLYKTGQWKAVSPRGLKKKYHDHTRYRKAPVILLCAGAYVPSDFSLVRAYPKKMYCWGYFPETKHYDVDKLLSGKGWGDQDENRSGIRHKVPYILWAARMIHWKHPELALETARHLKSQGIPFHLEMIGGGSMEAEIRAMRAEYGLEEEVSLPGFLTPPQVREHMEKADIFLFTSDRQEGWGAVANEAMNSGCAVLADHMIGAVPFLIKDGENGLIYRDGDKLELCSLAEKLTRNGELCSRLGKNAYGTITEVWNAEWAAAALMELCGKLGLEAAQGVTKNVRQGRASGKAVPDSSAEVQGRSYPTPCAPAKVISERRMYGLLKKEKRQ